MIYTDQFGSEASLGFEQEENYPTAFGLTFTPQVSGISLGILGLLAALYIIFNFGSTAFDNYQRLKQIQQEKQQQLDFQKMRGSAQKFAQADSELKEAKLAKTRVLSLFSSQQTIDTLLFDISNLASAKKIKITSFQPETGGIKAVDDGSFGEGLSGKLKQQSIELAMEGSFENTQKLLQDLERLQPLLLVRNIKVSIDPQELVGTVYVDKLKKTAKVVTGQQNKLNTSFTLKAILPLSAEELNNIAEKKPEPNEKK